MKKYFLGLMGLLLFIGASAFVIEKKFNKEKHEDFVYFRLNSDDPLDENDPDNWVFDGEESPTTICTEGDVLCTIKAPALWDTDHYIIDESKLTFPYNMRADLEIEDQTFKYTQ